MTFVCFHNCVIRSFLPGFAHASMAQPCKLEAAVSRATAENERLSRRTPRKRNDVPPHIFEIGAQPRVFRQQGGAISSQSEDERLLDRQRQARLGADWQGVSREPKRLATALLTARGKKIFARFFDRFSNDFRLPKGDAENQRFELRSSSVSTHHSLCKHCSGFTDPSVLCRGMRYEGGNMQLCMRICRMERRTRRWFGGD